MVREMDPAHAITLAARMRKNPLALKTLDLFASILGSASGNLALTGMATGGVYLGGGIPPGIIWALERGSFMKAFMNKGRFRGLMKGIPVRVILNEKAALMGAASHAFDL